jgi:mitochondrial Rho GTPase 1
MHFGLPVIEIFSDINCCQLQEFGSKYEAETLRNSKKTDLADVIVYVHDSSDTNSFSYISNLRVCNFRVIEFTFANYLYPQQQYSLDHIPTLFVATKSDLDLALQVCSYLVPQ